jgi:hypothetical protein
LTFSYQILFRFLKEEKALVLKKCRDVLGLNFEKKFYTTKLLGCVIESERMGSFMGKRMVYFCIALLLLSLGLATNQKASSQTQDVKVINYSWYIDLEGYLDVVGLVQNVGTNSISSVSLAGEIVGPGNVDVGDSGTPVWVSDLLPQQEAPFYMEFISPNSGQSTPWSQVIQAGEMTGITLTVTSANATSSYQYQGLSITGSKPSIGTTAGFAGAYVVNGVIKNTGDQSATNLTVVGAFFNSTGSVVGVGFTNYLTPTILTPGNTTTFQIAALDLNQSVVPAALKITKYQLLVQAGGPILTGTVPIASPQATGTTGTAAPTDNPASSPASSHAKSNSSILLPVIVAIVIAVIILVAVVAVVRQVMDRNERRRQSVKQARKSQRPKPKQD